MKRLPFDTTVRLIMTWATPMTFRIDQWMTMEAWHSYIRRVMGGTGEQVPTVRGKSDR